MTEKERIESIRFYFKKNKTEFAKALGYTNPQSYTSYLGGKRGVSIKMIKSLKDYDPRISIDWILNGQGQMLLNNDSSNQQKIINGDANHAQIGDNNNNTINSNNSNTNEIELFKNKIESLTKEVESLNKVITSQERLITVLEKNQK